MYIYLLLYSNYKKLLVKICGFFLKKSVVLFVLKKKINKKMEMHYIIIKVNVNKEGALNHS